MQKLFCQFYLSLLPVNDRLYFIGSNISGIIEKCLACIEQCLVIILFTQIYPGQSRIGSCAVSRRNCSEIETIFCIRYITELFIHKSIIVIGSAVMGINAQRSFGKNKRFAILHIIIV